MQAPFLVLLHPRDTFFQPGASKSLALAGRDMHLIPFLVPLVRVRIAGGRKIVGQRGFFLKQLSCTDIRTNDSRIANNLHLPLVIHLAHE